MGKTDKIALTPEQERWEKMKAERRKPVIIPPITDEIKSRFEDWWMFGDDKAVRRLRKMFR